MHKYDITPPEYIYIDMECQGTAGSPAQGVGHLIVYGIEGKQNDVGSDDFDALYVVEKGEMVMQTALDMNGHRVLNSNHYIHGYVNTINGTTFKLNGLDKILLPQKSIITEMVFYFTKISISYPRFRFKVDLDGEIHTLTLSHAEKYNKFATRFACGGSCTLVLVAVIPPVPQHAEIMMLLTYIVP